MALAPSIESLIVSDLMKMAGSEFVRRASKGENTTDYQVELVRSIDVPDKSLTTLNRPHRVAVRLKVTCESLLFDRGPVTSVVIPPKTGSR